MKMLIINVWRLIVALTEAN